VGQHHPKLDIQRAAAKFCSIQLVTLECWQSVWPPWTCTRTRISTWGTQSACLVGGQSVRGTSLLSQHLSVFEMNIVFARMQIVLVHIKYLFSVTPRQFTNPTIYDDIIIIIIIVYHIRDGYLQLCTCNRPSFCVISFCGCLYLQFLLHVMLFPILNILNFSH